MRRQRPQYRNTLLFLVANSKGLGKLRAAYRERAALKGVQDDYGVQLDHEQLEDLKKRLETAEKSAVESLGAAYTVALRVAGQEVDSITLPDARPSFSEHLAFLWQTLVEDEEWILRKIGPVTLKNVGLVPDSGGIAINDAVEAFLKFTDKPMIASRIAVTSGVANACRDGLLGIGRGLSLSIFDRLTVARTWFLIRTKTASGSSCHLSQQPERKQLGRTGSQTKTIRPISGTAQRSGRPKKRNLHQRFAASSYEAMFLPRVGRTCSALLSTPQSECNSARSNSESISS